MMPARQPDKMRGNMAFVIAIVLGYLIGILIKRVHIGLILGLAIGLLASGIYTKTLNGVYMNDPDEKVPLFKTWNRWYGFVVVFLVILIVFFYFFTKYFS
jgi:hypothetical protein